MELTNEKRAKLMEVLKELALIREELKDIKESAINLLTN